MSPDLAALFARHRTAVLGGGAAAVVGLALLKRKKAAAAPPATTRGATLPAAAVVPTGGSVNAGGYNSSSSDVYQALQPELEKILQQQQQNQQTGGGGITAAPKPVASTLFAPTGTGKYVRYRNGTIAEVESDGSVYGIAPQENWNYDGNRTPVELPWFDNLAGGPSYSDLLHNLTAAGKTTA